MELRRLISVDARGMQNMVRVMLFRVECLLSIDSEESVIMRDVKRESVCVCVGRK